MRRLAIGLSMTVLASSGASARDAGILTVAGDTASAARLAAAFGTVTSIHRTVERNRLVGGVPNSFHLSGRAIDVARKPGVTHDQIAAALRRAGYSLIESLDEGDHSHFAFGSVPTTSVASLAPGKALPDTKPKVEQPVLADNHGTLILDLPVEPRAGGVITAR